MQGKRSEQQKKKQKNYVYVASVIFGNIEVVVEMVADWEKVPVDEHGKKHV